MKRIYSMIEKKKKYKLGDFDYPLPKKYIAQYPSNKRDQAKLMVVNKKTKTIEHKKFNNIGNYLRKNDLLILNNTKVFPARLFATKDRTDAKVEVFLLRELAKNLWEVMVRPARKVRIGNKLVFTSKLMCDVIDNTVSGGRVVRFESEDQSELHDIINRIGTSPLPPYITREPEPSDKKRYQTVYATERGAVAAPTAGLHFTNGLINRLEKKGVKIEYITLHIGLGTFRPVQVEDLNRHQMDSEYFEVSPKTAMAINDARKKRRKIVAVGTSTIRALETVVVSGFMVSPKRGWTDKFIYPPYEYKMVDSMVTNFHMPKSTLMMMVSAFTDINLLKKAYREAKKHDYRFLSYGDAMIFV
jgi:S-adenosylmethionine:tRNA ribosyltransferase-isomerase